MAEPTSYDGDSLAEDADGDRHGREEQRREEHDREWTARVQALAQTLSNDSIGVNKPDKFLALLKAQLKPLTDQLLNAKRLRDDDRAKADQLGHELQDLKRQLKNGTGPDWDEFVQKRIDERDRTIAESEQHRDKLEKQVADHETTIATLNREKRDAARDAASAQANVTNAYDHIKAEKQQLEAEVRTLRSRAEERDHIRSTAETAMLTAENKRLQQDIHNKNQQLQVQQDGHQQAVQRALAEAKRNSDAEKAQITQVLKQKLTDLEASRHDLEDKNRTLQNNLDKNARSPASPSSPNTPRTPRTPGQAGQASQSLDQELGSSDSDQSADDGIGSPGHRGSLASSFVPSRRTSLIDPKSVVELNKQLDDAKKELEAEKARAAALDAQVKQLQKDKDASAKEKAEELSKKEKELTDAKDNIAQLQKQVDDLQNDKATLAEREKELTAAKKKATDLEARVKQLQEDKKNISAEKDKELKDAKDKAAKLDADIQKLQDDASTKEQQLSDAKKESARLQEQTTQLQNDHNDASAKKDKELADAKRRHGELEAHIAQLQDDNKKIQAGKDKELADRKADIARLQDQFQTLQDDQNASSDKKDKDLSDTRQKLADLEDKVKQLEAEKADQSAQAAQRLADARQQVTDHRDAIKALQNEKADASAKSDAELAAAKQRVAELEAKVKQSEAEKQAANTNMSDQVTQIQAQLDEAKNHITELEGQLKKCHDDKDDALAKKDTDLTDAKNQLAELQQHILNLEDAKNATSTQKDEELKHKDEELAAVKQQITNLSNTMKTLHDAATKQAEDLTHAQQKILDLETQAKQRDEDDKNANDASAQQKAQELEQKNHELADAKQREQDLQDDRDRLLLQLTAANRDLASAQQELERAKAKATELGGAKQDVADKETKLNDCNDKVTRLEHDLEDLRDQLRKQKEAADKAAEDAKAAHDAVVAQLYTRINDLRTHLDQAEARMAADARAAEANAQDKGKGKAIDTGGGDDNGNGGHGDAGAGPAGAGHGDGDGDNILMRTLLEELAKLRTQYQAQRQQGGGAPELAGVQALTGILAGNPTIGALLNNAVHQGGPHLAGIHGEMTGMVRDMGTLRDGHQARLDALGLENDDDKPFQRAVELAIIQGTNDRIARLGASVLQLEQLIRDYAARQAELAGYAANRDATVQDLMAATTNPFQQLVILQQAEGLRVGAMREALHMSGEELRAFRDSGAPPGDNGNDDDESDSTDSETRRRRRRRRHHGHDNDGNGGGGGGDDDDVDDSDDSDGDDNHTLTIANQAANQFIDDLLDRISGLTAVARAAVENRLNAQIDWDTPAVDDDGHELTEEEARIAAIDRDLALLNEAIRQDEEDEERARNGGDGNAHDHDADADANNDLEVGAATLRRRNRELRDQIAALTAERDRLEGANALLLTQRDMAQQYANIVGGLPQNPPDPNDPNNNNDNNNNNNNNGNNPDGPGNFHQGVQVGIGGDNWRARAHAGTGTDLCCGGLIWTVLNLFALFVMMCVIIAEAGEYRAWRDANAVTRGLYMARDDQLLYIRLPNFDFFFEWVRVILEGGRWRSGA